MDYSAADASAIEDRNALALAIVPSEPGNILSLLFAFQYCYLSNFAWPFVYLSVIASHIAGAVPTFQSNGVQAKDFDPTGWELALVTTPSSNISSVNDRQLVGPNCIPSSLFCMYILFLFFWSF